MRTKKGGRAEQKEQKEQKEENQNNENSKNNRNSDLGVSLRNLIAEQKKFNLLLYTNILCPFKIFV